MHHASGLIIIKPENGGGYSLLSQQRSYKKEKNAGLWDMSASGHITSGQTPLQSLLREVEEELGLKIEEPIKLLGKFWRHEKYREDFIENELDYIYILNKNIDINTIKVQKEEVEKAAWIDIEEFKKLLKNKQAVRRKYVWAALFKYIEGKEK